MVESEINLVLKLIDKIHLNNFPSVLCILISLFPLFSQTYTNCVCMNTHICGHMHISAHTYAYTNWNTKKILSPSIIQLQHSSSCKITQWTILINTSFLCSVTKSINQCFIYSQTGKVDYAYMRRKRKLSP